MKHHTLPLATLIALLVPLTTARAQVGTPYIHDPSTIAECDGKYYTFGTGGGGLISDDGWTWHGGAVRPGGGAAPDVLKLGDRYLVVYGATGGGLGGGHNGRILTMWNRSLDPQSADFAFSEPIEVAASDGLEDCDAIDPGLLLDPTTGRLWVSYGTYFGSIRLIELDPVTGARKAGNVEKDIAIDCEATDLIYRDGWYYLLGTHGTCCDGVNSTYNIVAGRSRSVEGPYLDNVGRDMLHGAGRMVIAAEQRRMGPGHFGRTVIDDGVELMSCHFEADMDRSGRSVLATRPLLWRDGWPEAAERIEPGCFEIRSARRGYSLSLAVDFVRMQQEREPFWRLDLTKPLVAMPAQTLIDVAATWPAEEIPLRCSDYMARPHQHWVITPLPDRGTLSGPLYTIKIAGTERALTATASLDVTTTDFRGDDAQLWRIEQLTDGAFRIVPYTIPDTGTAGRTLCLYSAGDSTPTLAPWDFSSDNAKWHLRPRHDTAAGGEWREFVMQLDVTLGQAYAVGETPHGRRNVIPITGGTFEGPRLRGTILPGGADWQLSRGAHTELEAIYSIRTDDGVNIHIRNRGIISNAPDSQGHNSFYFKAAPTFEAPDDSPYAWLNNALFVCEPAPSQPGTITLKVWRIN